MSLDVEIHRYHRILRLGAGGFVLLFGCFLVLVINPASFSDSLTLLFLTFILPPFSLLS